MFRHVSSSNNRILFSSGKSTFVLCELASSINGFQKNSLNSYFAHTFFITPVYKRKLNYFQWPRFDNFSLQLIICIYGCQHHWYTEEPWLVDCHLYFIPVFSSTASKVANNLSLHILKYLIPWCYVNVLAILMQNSGEPPYSKYSFFYITYSYIA